MGAVHAARRPAARGAWPARADGGADGAVPGQGADEGAARRRGPAHAGARERGHGRRGVGRRGAPRLPADRQADRRSRRRRTPTGPTRPPSSTPSCRCSGTCRRSSSRSSSTARSSPTTPSARAGGSLFENICWYRPRPLLIKLHEWVSPVTICAARSGRAGAAGRAGRSARRWCAALGFRDGFTHMEWYRKADGEVVFGEIGARPPGGRMVDVMNYATDADLFFAWARGRHAGPDLAAGRAALQRRAHLQARRGRRPDHPLRGAGPPAGRVRGARGGARPAAGRGAAARLAGQHHLRRHGDRPPPRSCPKTIEMTQRFAAELRLYAG